MELGKTTIRLGSMTVSIFDRERTVIDAFRLLSREIAIKALKAGLAKRGKNRLNSKKLEEYSKKLRCNIAPYFTKCNSMISEQSLKDRLHVLSLPFNACWKQLILERFLARLHRSSYANKLIFKGGFLLAYIILDI